MSKEKEEWATYTMNVECPKGHMFITDIDCFYEYADMYKGYDLGKKIYVTCEECNKEYRIN